jgi:2-methylcitrate dehydratase PrpD
MATTSSAGIASSRCTEVPRQWPDFTAAQLAAAGFRSGPLEGEPPRLHGPLTIVADAVDAEAALDELGEQWLIAELAYKPYPVGLLNVGAVEICAAVVREEALDPSVIRRIHVATYKDAAHFVNKYTSIESDFIDCYLSLPYCIAATLIDGSFWLEQLEEARIRDPRVHELARRVEIFEDREMTARYPHEWPIAIEIDRSDGPSIKRRVDAVAWSPSQPPTGGEIVNKFDRLTQKCFDSHPRLQIVNFVSELESARDATDLLKLLRS